ncbi:hypothetical protein BDA99DRAFT_537593 [Phascolomyces articulosus]|uniref:Uncharacterized protein n=1 Tax=Phascolomyces articulosus TaxID=60185 RepID=A0AAD5JZL7_9FUNG|nr:hypothetical protein BDA99DRAFT_537593 [Phascolomyces articulosus]
MTQLATFRTLKYKMKMGTRSRIEPITLYPRDPLVMRQKFHITLLLKITWVLVAVVVLYMWIIHHYSIIRLLQETTKCSSSNKNNFLFDDVEVASNRNVLIRSRKTYIVQQPLIGYLFLLDRFYTIYVQKNYRLEFADHYIHLYCNGTCGIQFVIQVYHSQKSYYECIDDYAICCYSSS